MAGSATSLRLLALATVVALPAAGCARHDTPAAAREIDPTVLELVAPVSGESLRANAQLEERLVRARDAAHKQCLETMGYRDLPALQLSRGRFFDFPDPKDLRAHAFHHYVDPDPSESEASSVDDRQLSEDAIRCQEEVDPTLTWWTHWRDLSGDWLQQFTKIKARSEEQHLWEQAADCLVDRGYPRDDLDREEGFFAAEKDFVEAGATTAERARRERKAANDYVDCVEPVWSARTRAAKRLREQWVEEHDEELRALSEQLRAVR
jgi:hypothetical protein